MYHSEQTLGFFLELGSWKRKWVPWNQDVHIQLDVGHRGSLEAFMLALCCGWLMIDELRCLEWSSNIGGFVSHSWEVNNPGSCHISALFTKQARCMQGGGTLLSSNHTVHAKESFAVCSQPSLGNIWFRSNTLNWMAKAPKNLFAFRLLILCHLSIMATLNDLTSTLDITK